MPFMFPDSREFKYFRCPNTYNHYGKYARHGVHLTTDYATKSLQICVPLNYKGI